MNVNRELIKELRIRKSWSQEKLAEKAGVSLRTIQRIETDGVASLQSRISIAKALDVAPAELDTEINDQIESESLFKRLLLSVLNWIWSISRGIAIFIVAASGIVMTAMALLKPFKPENIGLFTRDSSVSFGIIGNTTNMQEHLGYWVIPLGLIAGWLLFKCLILLNRASVKLFPK